MGNTPNRPLCHPIQQSSRDLHITNARQPGVCSKRPGGKLDRVESIRLSPNKSTTKGRQQSFDRQNGGNTHSSHVAKPKLVHTAIRTTGRGTHTVASRDKPTVDAGKSGNDMHRPPVIEATRVEIMRQLIEKREFSNEAASYIAQPQRDSTINIYESKWKSYVRWCRRRSFDPIYASIPTLADFFLFLFHKGLKPGTIEAYRSAIAPVLKLSLGIEIGQNADLTSLLRKLLQTAPELKTRYPGVGSGFCSIFAY